MGRITFSKGDFKRKMMKQEGRCAYCCTDLRHARGGIHRDHVIPYSYSASSSATEIVLACRTCNLRKSAKMLNHETMAEFMVEMIESHGCAAEGWPDGAQEYWELAT